MRLNIISKKFFSRLEGNIPCVFFCPFLILGQLTSFYLFIHNIKFVTIISLLSLLVALFLRKLSFLIFYILGIFSFLLLQPKIYRSPISEEETLLIRVVSNISMPNTNQGTFKAKVLGISHREFNLDLQNFKKENFLITCSSPLLPWLNISKLKNGDTAIIRGKFRKFNTPINPFSYDAYVLRNGISQSCNLKFLKIIKKNFDESLPTKIRNKIKEKVFAILGDNESSGLFLSMSIGARNLLAKSTEESFKRTGLTHLLVVSGYQVCVIYFSFLFLLNFIPRMFPRFYYHPFLQIILKIIALNVSIFFVFLSGSDSSSVRAGIAMLILNISHISERNRSFLNTIFLSFFILHLISPLCVLDPGIALSYSALLGIWLGSKVKGKIMQLLLISFYTYLTTGIVTLLWFKQISIISIFLNILIAPFISIVSCNGGFLAILFSFIGDTQGLFIKLISFLLDKFKAFVIFLSNYEFIYFTFSSIPFYLIFSFLLIILFVVFRKIKYFKNFWGL